MNQPEVWTHLEEDTRVGETLGRVQRRILPGGRRNFFLGLETPSRNRMLIFRVAANTVEGMPEVPDSRGLTVRVMPRETDSNEVEVVLALTEPNHRDIFDLLVNDLVTAAEQPDDEKVALARFLARLSDWQQLLKRLGARGLTREAQQGLWGELWSLREVVAPVAGMRGAADGWRGPMGANQDFQLGNLCMEVKTTSEGSLDRLNISSERQLEVPADVTLLLLGLLVDRRAGHGETLPDMVESVRTAAAQSGCLELIDLRLDLSGYQREDASLYSDVGYTLRSLHPFRVEEGFPKIISTELQIGISDVQYVVSTASSARFRITVERPEKLLENLL